MAADPSEADVIEVVVARPDGPWSGAARRLAEALLLSGGPSRHTILRLPQGYAAIRLPALRYAALDLHDTPIFPSRVEAARWILRQRWRDREGAG